MSVIDPNGGPMKRLYGLACSPKFWQFFHGFMVFKWIALFIPGMWLWRENIGFLMYVSLDTALTGALAAYGSALAARKADPEDSM